MRAELKAHEYTYRIHWSPNEHAYVAFVAEFPAMRSLPEVTPHAALHALTTTVVEKLNQLDAEGEPRPLSLGR